MGQKFSELHAQFDGMRKENEKKFKDERSKSEKEYKKEIEKMQQQLIIF